MAANKKGRTQTTRPKVAPEIQERLRGVASELRQMMYGEAGCPEWGTLFQEIEQEGMNVGLELARLLMEQTTADQAGQMPEGGLQALDDEVAPAGSEHATLETLAGPIEWEQPCGYLKKGRKAFFPSQEGAGPGCG